MNKTRDGHVWPRADLAPLLSFFTITITHERTHLAYDVSEPFQRPPYTLFPITRTSHTDYQLSPPPHPLDDLRTSSTVTIPFLSEEHAQIVKQVLDVDRELQPHAVKRVLEVQGNNLIAFVFLRSWDLEPLQLKVVTR